MPSSRQLAAIMFTDIVGYTALMGRDEAQAFEILRKNRQIQKPVIEKYGGRWIKELGDGVMASFTTVSDAVQAAQEILLRCSETNEFTLRIGIHQGEIIREGDDVFGDAVNIASRIQSIAAPGSIYVSEAVHVNLVNKKEFHTEFIRSEQLKNVAAPLNIYELVLDEKRKAAPASGVRRQAKRPRSGIAAWGAALVLLVVVALVAVSFWQRGSAKAAITSIAVIPLFNENGNAEMDFLSDGLTETLINRLSQVPNLKVKARSSVFSYKGRKDPLTQVAKELGVEAVLNGRIVSRGSVLAISLELVNAKTGDLIWGEKYQRSLSELVSLQSDIVSDVSHALRSKLSGADEERIAKRYTENSLAYQEYLKGRYHTLKYSKEGHQQAVRHFNEAIRLDPDYALAWAGLADAYTAASEWLLSPAEAMSNARIAAEKALMLDRNLSEAHAALGHIYVHQFNPEARAVLQRALELDPNSVAAMLWTGESYFGSDLEKGVAILRRARELDPLSPVAGYFLISSYYMKQRFDEALVEAEKNHGIAPNDAITTGYAAFCYSGKGNYTRAIQDLEKATEQIASSQLLGELARNYALAGRRSDALKTLERMHERVKLQYMSPYDFAVVYFVLGQTDQALDWLDKARLDRSEWFGWIESDYRFDRLRSHPRYRQLIDQRAAKL